MRCTYVLHACCGAVRSASCATCSSGANKMRAPLPPTTFPQGWHAQIEKRKHAFDSSSVQVNGIHGISMEHSCNIKRLFMEKKWNIYIYKINCISKEYLWYGDGLTMAIQWLYKDLIWKLMNMITISIVYPGNTMVCFGISRYMPWYFHGYTLDIPWVYHWYSMVKPLSVHVRSTRECLDF